ncbi:MAG: hypothetical protein IKY78_01765 [Clostridia bacterium]|nr:hypothetical protein [Clostridia bacterium]
MKKYTSQATKWLRIVSLICGGVLLMGIILAFADIGNIGVPIGLMMMGGLLGIIFFSCFIAEKSRVLIIDADQITFPRGAVINGKTVLKKTTIQLKQIRSVEIKFQPGDGIIAKDTNFYTLRLKDGTRVTVILFSYGKEAEKEILETIKSSTA